MMNQVQQAVDKPRGYHEDAYIQAVDEPRGYHEDAYILPGAFVANAVESAPTIGQQLTALEKLNARLDTAAIRLTNLADALHGSDQPRTQVAGGESRAPNGMGALRTLAVLSDRAHDQLTAIEHQISRFDAALG